MMVVAFDGEHEAGQVLDTLKGLKGKPAIDLRSAMVIVRPADGKVGVDRKRTNLVAGPTKCLLTQPGFSRNGSRAWRACGR